MATPRAARREVRLGPFTPNRKERDMPEKKTIERAQKDLKQGKSASTAAGEFVHEEIDHIRQGKHGARSTKQAIAIGLSKARRAGVPLPPPKNGQTSESTRRSAERDSEVGQGRRPRRRSTKRSQATRRALKREPRAAASSAALSRQAKGSAARRRTRKASGATATNGTRRSRASTASSRRSRSSQQPKRRTQTRRSSPATRRSRAQSATA
jgi:hypothetical protein